MTVPSVQGSDSLQPVLDSIFATPEYRWVNYPDPLGVVRRWWQALRDWFFGMDARFPGFTKVVGVLLLALLIILLLHFGWILLKTIRTAPGRMAEVEGRVARTAEWYHAEADRLARNGEFVPAMQAEFLALVLTLDQAGLLQFQIGKTPAEYLAEARLPEAQRLRFGQLVSSLYGYAFARWPCDASQWRDWRSQALAERYAAEG